MPSPSSPNSHWTITSTYPLHTSPPTQIPVLGFGIYRSPPSQCVQSCLTALANGYRHIDSAQFYGNEAEMGEAVRASGIPRSQVFLTTKIMAPGRDEEGTYAKCVESVRRISGTGGTRDTSGGSGTSDERGGVEGANETEEYVDLFLIHTASGGPAARRQMWLALERLLAAGKTRAIGVSNYGVGQIEEMKEYASVWPPHVNQIELHPFCQQPTITTYCARLGIAIQAYSPLVRNRKASHPVLLSLAKNHHRHHREVAQQSRHGAGSTEVSGGEGGGGGPNTAGAQAPLEEEHRSIAQKDEHPSIAQENEHHPPAPSVAQILIRYSLQKNWIPLPKSDHAERIVENANVFGAEWELSQAEMAVLDGLDEGEEGEARGAVVQVVRNG